MLGLSYLLFQWALEFLNLTLPHSRGSRSVNIALISFPWHLSGLRTYILFLEADGQQVKTDSSVCATERIRHREPPRHGVRALVETQFGTLHWSFRVEVSSGCTGRVSCQDIVAAAWVSRGLQSAGHGGARFSQFSRAQLGVRVEADRDLQKELTSPKKELIPWAHFVNKSSIFWIFTEPQELRRKISTLKTQTVLFVANAIRIIC